MRTVASLILAVLVLAWSSPALGQGAEMAGKKYGDNSSNVDQQITNASKQLEEALKAYVTRGKSTAAGVSGAVSSLLIDSDTIICASWLMAFERTMTSLAIKGAFQSDEGAALMQAMQNLKNRVDAACQGVLNNEDPPRNAGPGDGSTPSGTCPECDDERDAYETAQYRFDRAQFELDRARVRTDAAYDVAATHPEIYNQLFVSTPQQLEADQDAKEDALERARKIRDTAHRLYLSCLEACHKRTSTQVGFFESKRNKYLVGAAAVVVTGLAFTGGGGGTPAAVVSTPAPVQVVSIPTSPTVVNTPVPTQPPPPPPTLLSTVPGRWICILCALGSDPDHHEDVLRNCPPWLQTPFEMEASGALRLNHSMPWVVVTGNLDESTRRYRGTGMGQIGPFSNVTSTVVGDFDGTGEAVRLDLVVTLGENGVFPGGRPVSYMLRLTKAQ